MPRPKLNTYAGTATSGDGSHPSAAAAGTISPRQLAQRLERGDAVFILDVREAVEWQICRLDGATLIPLPQLAARAHEVPRDRDIVAYCRTGARSGKAAALLRGLGYTVSSTSRAASALGHSRWTRPCHGTSAPFRRLVSTGVPAVPSPPSAGRGVDDQDFWDTILAVPEDGVWAVRFLEPPALVVAQYQRQCGDGVVEMRQLRGANDGRVAASLERWLDDLLSQGFIHRQ